MSKPADTNSNKKSVWKRLKDWFDFDDGMRGVFALGSWIAPLSLIGSAVIGIVLTVFGGAWNFFDAAGGFAAAYKQTKYLKSGQAKRHIKQKIALIVMDIAAATHLSVATVFSLLAAFSIIAGAAILGPWAGFAFAFSMLTMAIRSGIELHRAYKKKDMAYLFHDRVLKYQNLEIKLSKLDKKLESESNADKKSQIQAKTDKLEETQVRVKRQIKAIGKAHRGKLKPDSLAVLEDLPFNLDGDFKPYEKELVRYLQDKQEAKIKEGWQNVIAWGLFATVGMTLVALALIFPPLTIVALVWCAIGGLIKAIEVGVKHYQKRKGNKKENEFLAEKFKDVDVEKTEIKEQTIAAKMGDEKSLKGLSDKDKDRIYSTQRRRGTFFEVTEAVRASITGFFLRRETKQKIKAYFQAQPTRQRFKISEDSRTGNLKVKKAQDYTIHYQSEQISFAVHKPDDAHAILKEAAAKAIESWFAAEPVGQKIRCELTGSLEEKYYLLQECQEAKYRGRITVTNAADIERDYQPSQSLHSLTAAVR